MGVDIAPHKKQAGCIVKSMLDLRNAVIYVSTDKVLCRFPENKMSRE